jgi:hypothetical protein
MSGVPTVGHPGERLGHTPHISDAGSGNTKDEASSAADGRTPNTVRVPVRTEGLFGAKVYAEVDVEVAGQWDTRVSHDLRLGKRLAGPGVRVGAMGSVTSEYGEPGTSLTCRTEHAGRL